MIGIGKEGSMQEMKIKASSFQETLYLLETIKKLKMKGGEKR